MIISTAQTSEIQEKLKPVTVCEILNNRSSYNGKTVAIIGSFVGTMEGFWINDECLKQIKEGNRVWPNSIFLRYDPTSPTRLSKGLEVKDIDAKQTIAQLKRRIKPVKGKYYWAVAYGVLETSDNLQTGIAADGKTIIPDGYGHLNAAPAQIIYREKDLLPLFK